MEDKNIKQKLIEWVRQWRSDNGVSDDVDLLSIEYLDKFVGELQNKIVNVCNDFGKNSIGENAKLVLYLGVDYGFVEEFCKSSNGEYYMISQTVANVLWDNDFRKEIAYTIGETKANDPITARVLEGKEYNADGSWERINQYATESGKYLALDDFLSSKVAEAGLAKGNVVYLVGDGLKSDSVGLLTEVPTVLNDANNGGMNLSDVVTVGKNLTQNADGSYSFEIVDCSDVSVYLDQSGKVIFVDFVETISGNPSEITDYELELDYVA